MDGEKCNGQMEHFMAQETFSSIPMKTDIMANGPMTNRKVILKIYELKNRK